MVQNLVFSALVPNNVYWYKHNCKFVCYCVWVRNVDAHVGGVLWLRAFENRALRRTFGPNADNMAGERRRL
jgi:hypothetical protein